MKTTCYHCNKPKCDRKLLSVVGHKQWEGFVIYKVKLEGLKNEVSYREEAFTEDREKEILTKYREQVSGQKFKVPDERTEVEKILSHRRLPNSTKRVYLVKWKNWEHRVWATEKKRSELQEKEQEMADEYMEKYRAANRR